MPLRGGAGRKTQGRSAPSEETAARIKRHFANLPFDKRLAALRFGDRALVRRADVLRQKLYESECACYHRGIGSRDPAQPEGTVTAGLAYFQFEQHSTAGTGDPGGQAAIPENLFVTQELVEDSDYFFGYLENAVRGTRTLFEGAPACRHRTLISALEQTPNTWAEFERQLVQLIELVLVRLWCIAETGAPRDQGDGSAEPISELPDLEELMLDLEETTSQPAAPNGRGSKQKAKKKKKAAQKSHDVEKRTRLDKHAALPEAERERLEEAAKNANEEAERKRFDEADDAPCRKSPSASGCVAVSDDDVSTASGSLLGPSLTHSRNTSLCSEAALAPHAVPDAAPTRPRPVWVSNGLSGDASQWCLVHAMDAPASFEQQWCLVRGDASPVEFEEVARNVGNQLCVRRTFIDFEEGPGAAALLPRRRAHSLGSRVLRSG